MMKIVALIFLFAFVGTANSLLGLFIDPAKIKYNLYSPTNFTTPVLITQDNIPASTIDSTQSVKVLIHGWLANAQIQWIIDAKNAYFTKNANSYVIIVDWSAYADNILSLTYILPAADAVTVGNYVGDTLLAASTAWGVPIGNFHVIGHSLGAHISGFAGQRIKTITSKIGRITGLDLAGPGYFLWLPTLRLSSDDAVLVNTIHTSTLLSGYGPDIGPIDFYPNGGVGQNGCATGTICSHERAPAYFIESISSNGFVGTLCSAYNQLSSCKSNGNTQNIMGENVNPLLTGVFYLNTNAASPYACGKSC